MTHGPVGPHRVPLEGRRDIRVDGPLADRPGHDEVTRGRLGRGRSHRRLTLGLLEGALAAGAMRIPEENESIDELRMPLCRQLRHHRPERPPEQVDRNPRMSVPRPRENVRQVRRGAIRRIPSAFVPRGFAVPPEIQAVRRESQLDQSIHEREVFAGNLQIEVRHRAPGPSVEQDDHRAWLGGTLLPDGHGMAVRIHRVAHPLGGAVLRRPVLARSTPHGRECEHNRQGPRDSRHQPSPL